MNLEKEMENIILVVVAVIAIALLMHFIGVGYTGFAVYGNELFFDNNSDYTSVNINFSDSEIKLVSSLTIENITKEEYYNYYIYDANYNNKDITNLVKILDGNYTSMYHGKLEFELENNKQFINNQTVSLYIINGSGFVYLCKSNGLCSYNGTNFIGGFQYDGKEGFYNITIINQPAEKKKLYLVGNIKLDYIYMIEKNTTTEIRETITYPSKGYIETRNITINDLNDFNYFFANYNRDINFYFLENETWKEITNGNITILENTKLKVVFISDTNETPILYNFTLLYNLNCYENWTCSKWSECTNGNETRMCNDNNLCGTKINKPELTEYCNISTGNETNTTLPENQTNVTTPAVSSGGSFGGGGGSRITPVETRTLEQPVQKEIVTENNNVQNKRILENKIDLCNNGIKDPGEKGIDCGGLCKKCNSIIAILPYTNYLLFIILVMVIVTLLDKGRKNENSNS